MTNYEYGIDWKNPDRRDDTPHRTGMTLEDALEFMHPEPADKVNWYDVFVIIRREIGEWKPVGKQAALKPDSEAAAFFAIHEKPKHTGNCRCIKVPSGVSTDLIGKDCLPGLKEQTLKLNLCTNGCGRAARPSGYCGPSGCYDYPG